MDTAKRPPRHFVYGDDEIAGSFLSDLLGGLPEGGSYTNRDSSESGIGFGLGFSGVGVKGRVGENSGSEDTENFRHTFASLFNHLHRKLDEEDLLSRPEFLDEENWTNLRQGDFVEITGTLKIPEIVKVMRGIGGLNQFLPLIEQLGVEGEIQMEDDERSILEFLQKLNAQGDSTESQNAGVLVAELPSTPEYRFITSLKRSFLKSDIGDLEGEATILGKIQRKINEGDRPIGIEQLLPGFERLRGIMDLAPVESHQAPDEFSIGHPAVTLIPVAIYL